MVQLVEVEDEHFQHPQVGPEEDDEDFTDTGTPPYQLSINHPPIIYLYPPSHAV
jgi:hypothetical protein